MFGHYTSDCKRTKFEHPELGTGQLRFNNFKNIILSKFLLLKVIACERTDSFVE